MRQALVVAVVAFTVGGAGVADAVDEDSVASDAALPATSLSGEALVRSVETWGFEPDEGLSPGFIGGQAGWSAFNGTAEAHIDTVHPHTGTQHLRISPDPAVPPHAYSGARSPCVPDTVADPSSVSMWVAISATGGPTYEIAPTGRYSRAATVYMMPNGDIYVVVGGQPIDTGADWTPGSYAELEIRVVPEDDAVEYYYGGLFIGVANLWAPAIEDVMLLSDNDYQVGVHADFDDLVIDRGNLGAAGPMLHRWSFTTDGTDSVGGADAVLLNGARVEGGALVLDGVDDHAELPISGTLRLLTDVSVEMWVTWDSSRSWERFFDFGRDTSVNWFMTPSASQTGRPRVAITNSGNPGEQRIDAPEPFPYGTRTHVVYTLEGDGYADQSKLYINGSLVAVHHEVSPLDPAELAWLDAVWLGRSQYGADPYFTGAIDEFIIYSTVLTDSEVLEHYQAIFSDGFDSGDASAWLDTQP